MIRILISFILILLCSSNAFAQSYRDRMRAAIDIGSHFDPFEYADTCTRPIIRTTILALKAVIRPFQPMTYSTSSRLNAR